MFTTEGHIVSVDEHLRESPWKEFFSEEGGQDQVEKSVHRPKSHELKVINSSSNVSCFFQEWFACGGRENTTNHNFIQSFLVEYPWCTQMGKCEKSFRKRPFL